MKRWVKQKVSFRLIGFTGRFLLILAYRGQGKAQYAHGLALYCVRV